MSVSSTEKALQTVKENLRMSRNPKSGDILKAADEPVSQAAQVRYDKVKPRVEDFLAKFNDFYQKDVKNFKKTLQEAGFSLFGPAMPLKIE